MTDFRENFQFPSLNDAMDKELYYLDKNWTSGDYDAMLNLAKSIVESTCKFICYQDNPKNDLNGITVVITGKLNHFKNRDEMKSAIEARGGKVVGSISSKTTCLINNDINSTSSKNVSAKKLNIPILSEDAFIEAYGF